MTAMRYVVTGGTGFIGRRVVRRLLDRSPDDEVGVLVRRQSLTRFERCRQRLQRRVLRPVSRPVKRAVRMVPGVHW